MIDSENPYEPPKAVISAYAGSIEAYWRRGKLLIMRQGSDLPCRCVKCNEPAVTPIKKRQLYWHPPGWYLIILLNLLIYAIVAMIVRKKATIAPGLCAAHTKRRNKFIAIGWLGFFASIGCIWFGIAVAGDKSGVSIILGAALFLITLVMGVTGSRLLSPSRIDSEFVELKGCGAAFLDSLPAEGEFSTTRVIPRGPF